MFPGVCRGVTDTDLHTGDVFAYINVKTLY
jgi:hypothetical protein